ncbi:MAG: TonB-dependent receptor [Burkholderiales bacterium]|nr:TonB-dependent receptor [Burkholderiales bacterium]
MSRVALALTLLLAGAPAVALAQQALADLSLEALLDMPVSGASRLAGRRSDSPAAVTVITREQIQALGLRHLSDVLRSVRGLDISSDGAYSFAAVRGMSSSGDYNTRLLLLVDGSRINDNIYDQAMLGSEFPLDLSLVERVEFIAGPASAVYGANALFGVVNVVTRTASATGRAAVSLRLGGHGQRDSSAWLDLSLAQGRLLLSASHEHDDGQRIQEPWFGQASTRAGMSRHTWLARWANESWRVQVLGALRQVAVPTSLDTVFGDPRNRNVDRNLLVDLEHREGWGQGGEVLLRGFAGRYRFLGDYVMDLPPVTLNRDLAAGNWWGLEGRLMLPLGTAHRAVIGAEWQRQQTQRQSNADLAPEPRTYLDDQTRGWRLGLYADDHWTLSEHWTLQTGMRLDRENQQQHASPRVALSWRAAPGWTWRLQHGRAFREPNAYERRYHGDGPGSWQANPNLHGESVQADELGLEWSEGRWRAAASAYRNRADGLTVLVYKPQEQRYQVRNMGQLRTEGLEGELEWSRDASRYRTQLSWSRLRSATDWPGAGGFPRLSAAAQAQWSLGASSTLALEALARSRRGDAPGHALINATWSVQNERRDWRLSFGVRNAADRRWFDPGPDALRQPLVRGEGRQFWVELAWERLP